jgi:hypothetical protein
MLARTSLNSTPPGWPFSASISQLPATFPFIFNKLNPELDLIEFTCPSFDRASFHMYSLARRPYSIVAVLSWN